MAGNFSGILSRGRVEQLAPDQASLSAALKLTKAAKWPSLSCSDNGGLLWGECQGSGAAPYRVVTTPSDAGYKCSCPSRKFPCKHVLALLWMACDAPASFSEGLPPDWVTEWQARRRQPRQPPADVEPGQADAARASLSQAEIEIDEAGTADSLARAAAQRQRSRERREVALLAGLDALDRWLADQIHLGLAGFTQRASQSIRPLRTRLVDHKAQGLANRLDMLAVEIFRAPERARDDLLMARLAGLALMSFAYRNQAALPAALREDVRRAVGWTVRREDVLADGAAVRVVSTWLVLATRSEVQPDSLKRIETWLLDTRMNDGDARFALLTDYVPVSGGAAAGTYAAGEVIEGEIVFYPSATPLRGVLNTSTTREDTCPWPPLPASLAAGLTAYETALTLQPWIENWPIAAADAFVVSLAPDRLALADFAGTLLPLDSRQSADIQPLLGLAPIAVAAIWDGNAATLLAAETAIGPWYGS